MRTKLSIPVVLLLVFGRSHSLDFRIDQTAECDLLTQKVYVGAVLSFGKTDEGSFTATNGLDKAGFGCLRKESRFRIGFYLPKESQLEVSLNVGSQDKPFESLDRYYQDVKGDEEDDFCFLFGTWWPSETNESQKVEIYISLLEPVRSISYRDVFYLSSISNNGVLKSSLYLNKERKKTPLKELGQSDQSKKDAGEVKRLEPEEEEESEVKKLIARFEKSDQTVVGDMRCDVKKDAQFDIVFRLGTAKHQGNGEFNMAFITDEIDGNDEEAAAKEFAEVGATEIVDTKWATLKCSGSGVDLASKYTFPLQNDTTEEEDDNEETRYVVFEDEDEDEERSQIKYATSEDKSEMLYSLTKSILKNVEDNQGKLKVTIEYEGHLDQEDDEDEFIDVDDEDQRRRIIQL